MQSKNKIIKVDGKYLVKNEAKLLQKEYLASLYRMKNCPTPWEIGSELEWFLGIYNASFYVGTYVFLDAWEAREYYLVLRKMWNRKFYAK